MWTVAGLYDQQSYSLLDYCRVSIRISKWLVNQSRDVDATSKKPSRAEAPQSHPAYCSIHRCVSLLAIFTQLSAQTRLQIPDTFQHGEFQAGSFQDLNVPGTFCQSPDLVYQRNANSVAFRKCLIVRFRANTVTETRHAFPQVLSDTVDLT